MERVGVGGIRGRCVSGTQFEFGVHGFGTAGFRELKRQRILFFFQRDTRCLLAQYAVDVFTHSI